jgi:hypothetical protein
MALMTPHDVDPRSAIVRVAVRTKAGVMDVSGRALAALAIIAAKAD